MKTYKTKAAATKAAKKISYLTEVNGDKATGFTIKVHVPKSAEVSDAIADHDLVMVDVEPTPEPEAPKTGLDVIGAAVEATQPKPKKAPFKLTEAQRKSSVESPCFVVWDLCDKMGLGKPDGSRRKDVLKACEDAGVAYYTARTQIQRWKKAQEVPVEEPKK